MSKVHQILALYAPETECREERHFVRGLRCGYCHGEGGFWSDADGEAVIAACPLCKGSGKMDAEVTVRWTSSRDFGKEN